MISILAIAIAAPVGIKTAMFIKYRLPVKYQKSVRIAVELLADIPSVIFGLFACEMLGMVLKYIFHMPTSYNLITTGFMLTFMILPTIVSLSLNALDGVDKTLISASMVLGNTKTRSIYKVCKKDARNGIAVGTIIAFARAIGETMAVSMILQSQGYNPIFNGGFLDVATSGLRSLGSLIAANMFAEGGGPALQSLLFAFGLFMFIFVMILNGIAMYATKKRNKSR
jgi:phosphate transport system permease protein